MSWRARCEITVHIGQTIRVSAMQGKNLDMYYIVDVACSIYLYFGTETITTDEGSIDMLDTF